LSFQRAESGPTIEPEFKLQKVDLSH
jgi:hypothetical protein